ncbi:diguanylate cyclase [Ruminococcus sp. NK3A76]|uniref:sensor domain-containing diguanylate cyclase n=1 Tax=Ruminococcus sp. NK3A76 TaxID=877411 RepID=UPI000491C158|nr:diguanylate cyclase [Ruminococcus sp. NK3A76]
MAKSKKSRNNITHIRHIQGMMIACYALLVIVTVAIVTRLALKKTDEVLKNEVISLTSSLGVQMKLNMDSYISRMETIGTLAFGEENAYTYDATDPDNDEYEAINKEKLITDKLFSLCIMENFVDYGIVYRNNRTVGKISNATAALFGDELFNDLSGMITRSRTNDGWATGYKNDFRRIYYVKKVHDNAVLVISFYSNELDTVFDNPETLSDMEIRLVNQDYNILYSKNRDEVGKSLPSDIKDRVENQSSASMMDNEYLVSVNSCDEWYVICSIPTEIILNEKNEMKRYIYLTGAAAAVAAALVGLYLSYLLTRPVKRIVSTLDDKARIDLLTGMLNKLTFEDYAENILSASVENEKRAMIILDIDDFKIVNDTLGHAAGDRVLQNMGRILKENFTDDDYLGRIGGDEFCVLVNARMSENEGFREHIESKCESLCEALRNGLSGDEGIEISASVGAAIFPESGKSFAELYSACDKALYFAKRSGKNRYSIFDSKAEKEGAV